MKPVVVVLTPSMDLARYETSSTKTPGARYSGMAAPLSGRAHRQHVPLRRADHELVAEAQRVGPWVGVERPRRLRQHGAGVVAVFRGQALVEHLEVERPLLVGKRSALCSDERLGV